MKTKVVKTFGLCVVILIMAGCGPKTPALSEADLAATVNVSVEETHRAGEALEATVNAAVAATNEVPKPTDDPAIVEPTSEGEVTQTTATPEITPFPTDEYLTMSEEELAVLIDQSVEEALAASVQSTAYVNEATADETLTQEEVESLNVYLSSTDEALALAEELIYVYYDLYGEYAVETLELLLEIEEDLLLLTESADEVAALLQEVNEMVTEGLEITEETIAQLEESAQNAMEQAAEMRESKQGWLEEHNAELDRRAKEVLSVQPGELPGDRQAALESVFDYVDILKSSLQDDKISQFELSAIAQAGAIASAGLSAHGGPGLQGLSSSINDLTVQVARGQVPQAKSSLGNFEASLPARPSRP